MRRIALTLMLVLLVGCTQWLEDDRLQRLTRKQINKAHTIKAYMIRDDSHPPVEQELGVIEGLSCQMTPQEREASAEEAIEKLCLKSMDLGGNGVIGIHHIKQPDGEGIGNCRNLFMFRGMAVKFSPDVK